MQGKEKIRERGYAKINLHLDITGRLEGGYHSVETVMQSISLYDEISVTPAKEGFCCCCNQPGVPTDEKNLAVCAAMLFAERVKYEGGARIEIEKHIPMAAGMAGGSADAAATLRAMNRMLGEPLSMKELCELGASLGADVPFCITGGTAYADGKGDLLHPIDPMPDCMILAACEGEGVSTPWAYGLLDRLHGGFEAGCDYQPKGTDALREALREKNIEAVASAMYNIFEEPVLEQRPVAADVKRVITECGALCAMMSGSGPSVFGVFTDEAEARVAEECLKGRGYRPFLCHPIRF